MKIVEQIRSQNRRLTKQRLAILGYLQGVTCHPTAEKIYHHLHRKMSALSLGTVYRNLRYLADNDFVLEINAADGFSHFDGNTRQHLHFICRCCGTIYDLWKKFVCHKKILEHYGFINRIECNLYGICNKCKKYDQSTASYRRAHRRCGIGNFSK